MYGTLNFSASVKFFTVVYMLLKFLGLSGEDLKSQKRRKSIKRRTVDDDNSAELGIIPFNFISSLLKYMTYLQSTHD